MPSLPKHPCAHSGCRQLVDGRYCDAHRRREDQRASARARGYDTPWEHASKSFLVRHPLCYYCELQGRTTAAQCVDHATPHCGDQRLFWDVRNWRPSCISCNSKKGRRDERTFLAELGVTATAPTWRGHVD